MRWIPLHLPGLLILSAGILPAAAAMYFLRSVSAGESNTLKVVVTR